MPYLFRVLRFLLFWYRFVNGDGRSPPERGKRLPKLGRFAEYRLNGGWCCASVCGALLISCWFAALSFCRLIGSGEPKSSRWRSEICSGFSSASISAARSASWRPWSITGSSAVGRWCIVGRGAKVTAGVSAGGGALFCNPTGGAVAGAG